ncbi:mandelate racemase/muconate lactonizing-like protein [Nitratireductor pacificus pht-3B]|uniref:Mandelate racemase/muconate lactonizing-like protein n=2 Tax=Nitratireductor TaxID=245876 RepID=K2MFD2_9HYPH|nr:mandelate racemase/muconate lactonizing-like protein [Nitratireductor pacificus pht-3B]
MSCAIVEVTTTEGIVGHGLTAITDTEVAAFIINQLAGPNIIGLDALHREKIAERLYWQLTPRGQTGFASHVVSAIDLALWDILGKATGFPCWKLLGGARPEVPLYVTFGFASLDKQQLRDAALHLKGTGVERFKMVAGHRALQRRDNAADMHAVVCSDLERVQAVREAIGWECELFVDANCSLDAGSAAWLAGGLRELKVSFFEEPVRDNDPGRLADLRRTSGLRLAAGQNEGQLWRFRDLLAANAVDVLQPNAIICGGYTAAMKVAALAQAGNVAIDNGGAYPFHNMHLHGGLAHGGLVEWHLLSVELCKALFGGLPSRDGSKMALPDTSGLGFTLDAAALRDAVASPSPRQRKHN